MNYTGYIILSDGNDILHFYDKEYDALPEIKENQYLLIKGEDGKIIDYYCYSNGNFRQLKYPVIENKFCGKIKPLNPQQYCAMDLVNNRKVPVKLIRGVYGSGKDHIMFNQALSLVEDGTFQKIVFVRPHVSVGNLPDIGYLPGTAEEKLTWTLAPLYDKAGGEEGIQYLISQRLLEMVPLNFIRGRSFTNSIVYMTEGQNMTTELVKLLIGRIGEGSELWINADNHQVDKKVYEQDNGIVKMIEKLTGNSLFSYVYLPHTERSEVARLCDLLDD